MPTWGQILTQLQELAKTPPELAQGQSILDVVRRQYLAEHHRITGRNVVVLNYSEMARVDADRWKFSISNIYNSLSPSDAANQLDDIRHSFESVCVATEAKLRILARRLEKISLPVNRHEELESMLSDCLSNGASESAIESTRNLISLVMLQIPGIPFPKCEAVSGDIEVMWETTSGLTWIVSPPKFSWPGVNVRAYSLPEDSQPESQMRSFALAHRVIDHALTHFTAPDEPHKLP